MENYCKRNLRLYKLFKNEQTVNNILEIYKGLRGKENAEYRLLLKALVYSTINCEMPLDGSKGHYYIDP